MSGIIYILLNGTLWTNITWWLRDKFYTLIYTSDYDEKGARILRIMQENVSSLRSFGFQNWVYSQVHHTFNSSIIFYRISSLKIVNRLIYVEIV